MSSHSLGMIKVKGINTRLYNWMKLKGYLQKMFYYQLTIQKNFSPHVGFYKRDIWWYCEFFSTDVMLQMTRVVGIVIWLTYNVVWKEKNIQSVSVDNYCHHFLGN